jgi:hypothetical protein
MTMKRVHEHGSCPWHPAGTDPIVEDASKPTEAARLRHMGVDNVRALTPDNPEQPNQRGDICPWANRAAQRLHAKQPRLVTLHQPAEIAFRGIRFACDDAR